MKILECLFCCVSLCGCKNALTRHFAFYPPRPSGYRLFKMGIHGFKIILFDESNNIVHQISVPWIKPMISIIKTSKKHRIPVIYFKNMYAESTLLFAHGNSTDIGIMYNYISDLSMQLKANILLFEYSGYGEASGKASEENMYADIKAAYEYLIETEEVNARSIILYGQSIGSAAVCELATRVQVAGVILHSPLASGRHFIKDQPKNLNWLNAFDNFTKVSELKCPIFVIHGSEDTDIPVHHGEILVKQILNPWPPWFPEAGHNDIEEKFRKVYLNKVSEFLSALCESKSYQESGTKLFQAIDEAKSHSNDMDASKVTYTKVIPINEYTGFQ